MLSYLDQYDGIYPGEEKYNYLTADLSQERPCMDKKVFTVNTIKVEALKVFMFLKTGLDNAMQRCLISHLCKVARCLEGRPRNKFRLRPCVELTEELFVQEILFNTISVFNNVKTWTEYDQPKKPRKKGIVEDPKVSGYLKMFLKAREFAKCHYWFSNFMSNCKLAIDLLIRLYIHQFRCFFAKNPRAHAKHFIQSRPSARKIANIIRGYKVKRSLADLGRDWFQLLCNYLVADWARRLTKVDSYLTSHIKILKAPIKDIRDIKRKMKALQDTRDKFYRTFKKYNMYLVDSDRVKVRQLRRRFQKLIDLREKTEATLVSVQDKFQKSITERSKQFEEKVEKFEKEFAEQGPLDPKITQDVACTRFYSMKNKLKKLYDEYQDLLDAQKMFGLPIKEYPTLSEKQEQFLILEKLYGLYQQIMNSMEEYYKVPWTDVDVEKIKAEILDYQAKLLKVPRHMREFPVYHYMTKVVDDFNETLPLLVLMADKSMLPRHWKRLEALTGRPFNVESKDFNLRNIFEANVLAYKDDVEDICVSAIKEKDIEAKLNQLISDWSQVNLTFAPFKERGDLFLKPAETTEIIALIEDSIMVIASLAANRYNAPFKVTIMEWLKNLSNSLEILESWMMIQNIWGYLEAVFSGGEISRQLPAEAKKFLGTDKHFVRLITKAKSIGNAIRACTGEETMKTELAEIAQELEECQKSLSGYLEQKRGFFPRFFFVSDPTLLEILGQATDSHLIQHHLLDVFENIAELRFSPTEYDKIEAIISMEKQEIDLKKPVMAVSGVENWLNNLLLESRGSLHTIILECWEFMKTREFQQILEMVNEFIAQVGLLGIQMYWTFRAEYALIMSTENSRIMKSINDEFLSVLNTFIDQTTKDLTKVERTKFETLVTIHVHQRDIFDEMVLLNITNTNDFQWLKQARFYIDEEKRCVVKITDVDFIYQNEFLGCQERLVVTPLTDRCYITCAQAIGMNLGAAPAGPAGTGKTETTKDMGRTLGKYVVVFNCSDQMDFRGLGRIFKGLAQSGSDGDVCSLNPEFGLFITMNPGYAGRQELPENIKYQFRSVAMMIIKRVRLAASGFKDNVFLARKFFTLYALCEEQLSKQVHYDFGLRNILSVLRTLGAQKRADPSQSEEKVVMRVLRDMNLSKLVDEDEPLFLSLIDDLFVGLTLSSSSYVELQAAIEKACQEFNFVNHPTWNLKVVQMYETSLVRHGLMLLGPTGSGKSCIIKTLMAALTTCGTQTKEMRMNPKAITAPQMFGRLDVATNDWTDGIFSVDKNKTTWLVLDGPVDAVWIENLNSVLDDNKTLTLANGDRIKMAPNSKIVFEPDNVDNASPATVSRMGMTFVSASVLPWKPCFEGWCKTRPNEESKVLTPLFNQIYADLLMFLQTKLKPKMAILEALYIRRLEKDHYEKCFLFSLMWSLGAVLELDDRSKFEAFVLSHKSKLNWPKPSAGDTIFEFKVTQDGQWEHWNSSVVDYVYPTKTVPDFLDILVPNVDNVRTNFLIDTIAKIEKNVLLIGEPGTAKTVMIKGYMKTYNPEVHLSKSFNFSSATTPNMVQRIIESYLEKRVGTIYGPPNFRKMSIFIDDISMPVFNDWGDQVTNEITRQLMEQGGFYSLDKPGEFSQVQDIQILAAMIHPGGGRNDIPPRLKRRFNIFNCTLPSNKSMDKIFSCIGQGYFCSARFTKEIVDFLPNFVPLTRVCWQQTKLKMLPTPAKFHYIFNLRDLSRIWQGMCNIKKDEAKNSSVLYKLWRHECMRTISDRFISQEERDWFAENLESNAKKLLGAKYDTLDKAESLFVDFLREPPEPVGDEEVVIPKVYELVPSFEDLSECLQRYQRMYNGLTKGLPMDLVFFKDFIYHLIIISRIIRTPKGNALLVGVGGSGKQSVTRLSTFIANYEMKQLVLTRTYNVGNLMDDIKILYRISGFQGKGVTFIFTDNDIKDETFLEPINNILSSGEVANLFPKDELDEILAELVPIMKKVDNKRPPTQDNLYDFFISRAKNNLHVTLCFSPVGEKFRSRALMFPGLVSGCTVDWYYKWPPDALSAVSKHFLSSFPITGTPQTIAALMDMMGDTHTVVSNTLAEYFEKFRRQSFVTPKSFLIFLESYKALYAVRRKKIDKDASQREIGLQKLEEAAVSVEELRKELVIKEKNIAVATAAADVILKQVSIKAAAAEKVKSEVEVVKAKAQELVDTIAADKKVAEQKLKAAEPALAAAEAALATIKPADINTVKALKTPPYLIQVIMDCVIILNKDKLLPVELRTDVNPPFLNPSWAEAGKLLNNVKFLSNLMNFKKDNINDETVDLMEPYIKWPNYTLESAITSCGQVAGLLSWTIAMKDFFKVNKEVLPLKANLAIQQIKLDQAMSEKEKAEAILREKNKEVAAAKAQLDTAERSQKAMLDEGNACKAKMDAATGLITGLAGEKVRWTEQATEFKNQALRLVGDILVMCGFLCYAGPFNQEYRTKIRERWYRALTVHEIPFTKDLSIIENLVDQPTISEWNLQGLPTDDLSTQNGIIVTQASRYPLLIDPQAQGITWIKNREKANHLTVTSINHKYFRQHLEDALVAGRPLLIAEVLEELDPVLDNVLEKNFVKQGTKYKLRLGDKDLEVLPFQFRLYITTKLANPSYTPEVSARCSIIDFTVTLKGLEDQLLARVILKERKELEDERLFLIKDGSLVDDDSVLKTLNVTKDTAVQVRKKIQVAYETEKEINMAREAFRPVANRGSILYFLICDMSLVNYMYQTSLVQFLERFDISMERSSKSERVNERISFIIDYLTDDVFRYKVRGLYEQHKFMFPLLLALRIDLDRKFITYDEFNYLLKGGAALDLANCPPKPAPWITDISWLNINELSRLPTFEELPDQVKNNEKNWKIWYGKAAPEEEKYITQSLGAQFADPVIFNMEAMVFESRPRTPLVNFLSMGSDPTVEIETLARKLRIPCQSISMGQAQEIHARKLIDAFVVQGGWALLQNCHLGLEYMTELFGYLGRVERCHPDFRVWITTEPHPGFPMSLLQIAIKFTSQPPAGLRAGLKRTYGSMSSHMFNYSPREEYTYLLFTTSFLHTVVQERRKFGPLGWNIPYEFNYADWYQTNTTNELLNTIIEIQPKESAGDGERESRETVVARLAKDMLAKLPPMYENHVCRDRYKAMGATRPLVIVLRQEIDRMQKVMKTVSTTLKDLLLAVDGIIIMNETLKDSLDNIFDARVPSSWKRDSWLSSSLGFWFTELIERNEQLSSWLYNGRPDQFWMTGFFNPQGFLTAMKQEVARANHWALDLVNITNTVTSLYKEGIKSPPTEGVFVYGLFLEGATWDRKNNVLVESQPKVLSTLMPVIHITAVNKPYVTDPKLYTCPVYKKPGRTGLNFITKLWLPCVQNEENHWILRAVALLCDTK
ncbi:hypothetical protein M8J75_004799 [Diaphorina citri]|nr:hypothetical protein M8J75_004799 [Diaphorina citri]